MPLIHGKSKPSFEHNLKAEMEAGKPMKQSLAIAYAVKRKAAQKKMAMGGEVNEDMHPMHDSMKAEDKILPEEHLGKKAQEHEDLPHPVEPMEHLHPEAKQYRHMAHGGMIGHPKAVAHMIMAKKMADGGMAKTPAPPPPVDPDTFKKFQASFNKNLAMGGEVGYPEEPDASYAYGGMVDDDDFLSDEEQTAFSKDSALDAHKDRQEMNDSDEDPAQKRKGMISKIMSDLASKHYGKS